MTTRTTRRAPLNSIESLLLAQAVWEHGAAQASWPAVAKILSKHPLLSRPKSFFTAQSCHAMYENLMKEADLEIHEDSRSPHAPLNLQLAQKHYRSRYAELRELILAEETRFKTILKEIEDIRAGTRVQETETSHPPPHQIEAGSAEQPPDEILSGSDLVNATELVDSTLETKDASDSHEIVVEENSRPTTAVAEVPGKEKVLHSDASSPTPSTRATNDQPKPLGFEADFELKDEVPTSSPDAETEDNNLADAAVNDLVDAKKLIDEDEQMEGVDTREPTPTSDKQVEQNIELIDQRQEEEEEEANEEEETKEEEEEASQGQEEVALDGDSNEGEIVSSPKSTQQADMETESEPAHTPATETMASEPEPTADEGHSSGLEEPVITTRRSSRRRKSSAASIAPPQTRTRLRSQARLSESDPRVAADSENDDQGGIKEDSPQIDDDQASSPDIGPTRRGKRKASFIAADLIHEKKRMREDSEPADEEDPGPSSHNTRARITRHATRTEEQVALKRFQNVIGMLHSQISQHRNGNIFHNPIKNSEAPDYHEIVKRPMDLKTIKTRFKDGVIGNSLEYQRDIYLMFANAMMYNRPGSDVHAMAEDMMLESEGQIIAFRQTEGLVKRGQRP